MTFQDTRQACARRVGLLCSALLLSLAGIGLAHAGTCHVTSAGTSGGIGSTWASPMDLQTALSTPGCTEVWVAAGVYKPGSAPTDAFSIRPGVAVYGGFAGTETSRGARDPASNLTILSGDIDSNDSNTDGNNIDETSADIVGSNSDHVVTMDGTAGTPITTTTVLDGFTITGGAASGSSRPGNLGGGLYCDGTGSGSECSPTLSNLSFSGNAAANSGGAVYGDGTDGASSPVLNSVTFTGNTAGSNGGAMLNDGTRGTSSPTLGNCTFSGNSAGFNGGAMFNEGFNGTSNPVLSNVTFSGNSGDIAGGIFGEDSSPTLSNVILWGDTDVQGAPEIYTSQISSAAVASIDHSIVQGSGGSGSWDTALGIDGGGNLDANPVLGALGNHGGSTATMLLGSGSAAIGSADPVTCISAPVNGLDQRGVFRFENNSILCDIGAVEMQAVTDRIFADGFEAN